MERQLLTFEPMIDKGDFYNDEWYDYGSGNKIHNTVRIFGNVQMGRGNIIYPYTVIGLGGFMRDRKANGQIVIGDDNFIGAHASIMLGHNGSTIIGNNNMVMNYVNIGHDVIIGDYNEITAQTIICGHTTVGDHNKIKAGCKVRNRLQIGDHNILGMGSNLVENMGSNEVWFGNPAKKR